MPSRQTLPHPDLPRRWLMTDRRLGDELWACIARLPAAAGVVLRHHDGDGAFAARVAAACAARGVLLAVAGDGDLALRIGAGIVHNPVGQAHGLLVSRSVHDRAAALAAREADLVFVSPVHATRSHPGVAGLGLAAAAALARLAGVPAIALGGMDEDRGAAAMAAGFHGWAAIDAWRALRS
jgi:thiamine-phosphate pyrophosphorylase